MTVVGVEGGVYTYGYAVTETDSQGLATITIVATDSAGNTATTENKTIMIDTIAPIMMHYQVLDANGQPDTGVIYLSDKVFEITFNEPVFSGVATFGMVPMTATTVDHRTWRFALASSVLAGFGSGVYPLQVLAFQDEAGNRAAPGLVDFETDMSSPSLSAMTLATPLFAATQTVESLASQNLKIGKGSLQISLQFSEPVFLPECAVMLEDLRLPVTVSSVTPTGMVMTAVLSTENILAFDNNTLTARVQVVGGHDAAGNALRGEQSFSVDLEAPEVLYHEVVNGLSADRDDDYYAVIKPYGIAGEQDKIRLRFELNELALQPEIYIYQVSPNVQVRRLSTHTVLDDTGTRFEFVWDGRDDSGALVGSQRQSYFYEARVAVADRAGNRAMRNVSGLLKVQHMDMGVSWSAPVTPDPASPRLGQTPRLRFFVGVDDHALRTSADFKAAYPGKEYALFANTPIWGTYTLHIHSSVAPPVKVYEKTGPIVTPFSPIEIFWDGSSSGSLVPDGRYTMTVTAVDNAGNAATRNATTEIQIDNTVPTITNATLGHTFVSGNSVSATVSWADPGQSNAGTLYVQVSTGSVSQPAVTGQTFVSPVGLLSVEGTQSLWFQAKDTAGNTSNVVSRTLVRDTVIPTATVTWQGGRPTANMARETSQNMTLTVTPVDANFDSGTLRFLSQTAAISGVGSHSLVAVSGNYDATVFVDLQDKAGNKNTQSYPVWLDTVAPVFAVGAMSATQVTASVTVYLTGISDASLPVKILRQVNGSGLIDLGIISGTGFSTTYTMPSEGVYTFGFVLEDRLGNRSPTQTVYTRYDKTAPTITLSPTGNATWKTTPVGTIAMTATDGGSGIHSTGYLWNSSDWTVATAVSPNATLSLPGDGVQVLRVRAVDVAGNLHLVTATYLQDQVKPSANMDYKPTGWLQSTPAEMTLIASDTTPGSGLQTARYTWNSTNVGTGTVYTNGSTTTVPGEGLHTLRTQATDTAGNQSDVVAWTYQVDTQVPSLSANKSNAAWVTASIGTVTLTVSDPTPGSGLQTQTYRWNNADVVNGTVFVSGNGITVPGDGAHELYLRATDVAGHVSTWQGQYRQDLQTPTVSATHAQSAWRTASMDVITLTASDPTPGSGLKESRYYWGAAGESSLAKTGTLYSTGTTVSMPSEGEKYLYLIATDYAGRESAIWTGTYRVDTSKPVVSATKSSSGWYRTAIGAISLSVSDATPGSGISMARYRWNNPDVSGGTAFTHGAEILIPSEGSHTLYIQAWDVAGNASAVWMGSYKQDTSVPTANASLSGTAWVTQQIGTVTLSVSDVAPGSDLQTAKYRWNNADVGNGTVFTAGQTLTVPSEGANTLYVQAWDVAGNASAVWQGAYNSDTQAPTLSATKASETWKNTAIGTLTLSVSDTTPGSGLATARYRWDNADVANGTVFVTGQTVSLPSEGAHILYLYAKDTAGNESQWQGHYRQDTVKPEISANKNQFVWYREPIGTITLSVTDAQPGAEIDWALTKYRWNNADVRNGTALTAGQTLSIPAEGANTLYLETFDNALNVSQTWVGIYNQDTQAPTAYATPTLETWSSANPTIVLHYADAGGSGWQYRQFRWNGGTWQAYTGQTLSVPAEGENTLELAAGDVAGNTVSWSGVYRVDWNAPVVAMDPGYPKSVITQSLEYDSEDNIDYWLSVYRVVDTTAIHKVRILTESNEEIFVSENYRQYVSNSLANLIRWSGWIADATNPTLKYQAPEGLYLLELTLTDSVGNRMTTASVFELKTEHLVGGTDAHTPSVTLNAGVVEIRWGEGTRVNRSVGLSATGRSHWNWGEHPDWGDAKERDFILDLPQEISYSSGGDGVEESSFAMYYTVKANVLADKQNIDGAAGYYLLRSHVRARGDRTRTQYRGMKAYSSGYQKRKLEILTGAVSFSVQVLDSSPALGKDDANVIALFDAMNANSRLTSANSLYKLDNTYRLSDRRSGTLYLLRNTTTGQHKFSSVSSEAGHTLVKNVVLPTKTGVVMNPSIATQNINGKAVLHLAWEDTRNGVSQIYYKRFYTGQQLFTNLTVPLDRPTSLASLPMGNSLQLLSPTQNPTLRTSTPVLTWQTPSPNAAHSILLTHESGLGVSGLSSLGGDSLIWRLLPGEIQWHSWAPTLNSMETTADSPASSLYATSAAVATYTPSWKDSLAPGTWTWQVQLGSNGVGPVSDIGTFTLDPPLEIHGVLNFPNPFKNDTRIRYKLSKPVNRLRIVIYTLAGDFVRELDGDTAATSPEKEYHDVPWNGRNQAGEEVVNGVYLYKVIAEGDGETKEASGRMFRLR